jgi:hypothetical protein
MSVNGSRSTVSLGCYLQMVGLRDGSSEALRIPHPENSSHLCMAGRRFLNLQCHIAVAIHFGCGVDQSSVVQNNLAMLPSRYSVELGPVDLGQLMLDEGQSLTGRSVKSSLARE